MSIYSFILVHSKNDQKIRDHVIRFWATDRHVWDLCSSGFIGGQVQKNTTFLIKSVKIHPMSKFTFLKFSRVCITFISQFKNDLDICFIYNQSEKTGSVHIVATDSLYFLSNQWEAAYLVVSDLKRDLNFC